MVSTNSAPFKSLVSSETLFFIEREFRASRRRAILVTYLKKPILHLARFHFQIRSAIYVLVFRAKLFNIIEMILIILILSGLFLGFYKRQKFPIFKKPGIFIFIPTVLFSPLVFIGVLFGMSGSDKQSFYFIAAGYFIVLVFSFISIKIPKLILITVPGFILLGLGNYKDSQFWKKENQNLCEQLRADPYCIEAKNSFSCGEKSSVHSFSSGNICTTKLTDAQINENNLRKRNLQISTALARGEKLGEKLPNLEYVGKANDIYEDIVKKIIIAPDPAKLDFEDQLRAIYNCINNEFDNQLKAEAYATMKLNKIAKTPDQQQKYKAYAASKGRDINLSLNIAALPAGDKKFNCTFLLEKK